MNRPDEIAALADELVGIQEELAIEEWRDALGKAAHHLRRLSATSPGGAVREVLRAHWLHQIVCNHEDGTDKPCCSCSMWNCPPQPSIGAAVEAWIDHVIQQLPVCGDTNLEVQRLLRKISDLAYDENASEPLDDAINYANKALAALAPAEKATLQKTSSIVTCCVTGAIPGDGGACGDCDPCILGEASVPEPVKRLISEKNNLLNRIGELEGELEEYRATPAPACVVYGVPLIEFLDGLADNAKAGKRRSLNPIIIGNSAKLFADEIRAATTAPPSGDVEQEIESAQETLDAYQDAMASQEKNMSDAKLIVMANYGDLCASHLKRLLKLIQSAAPGGGTEGGEA